MTSIISRCAAGLAVAVSIGAQAYEVGTHGAMTEEAASRSILSTTPALKDYGLDKSINDPFQTFPNFDGQSRPIFNLLVEGSQAEDTLSLARPLNHFYNAITGEPLNILGVPVLFATASPDWALAPRNTFFTQQRSYWDGRQYLFDALTKESEPDRMQAFGKAFQTLGHVVHHVQDMAQPQHVRNDSHCTICPGGTPSLHEKHTESLGRQLPLDPAQVGYDATSPLFTSAINSPRRFWNTEPLGRGPAGKGMAEFANRNFVTTGTNYFLSFGELLPNENFALPDPRGVDLIREQVNVTSPTTGQDISGEMWFIPNAVQDNLLGGAISLNLRGSTYSVFDPDLTRKDKRLTLTINRFNVEAANQFLIPRAVAYSTGMINYFFRGKMDLKKDEQDSSKFRIVNLGEETMNGRFALYYDAKDGKRYPVQVDPADPSRKSDGTSWFLTVAKLDPAVPNGNLSDPIAFIPPLNDDSPTSPKAVNEYMLVFSGNMGEEREDPTKGVIGAVAAKAIKAEYNGLLYVKVLSSTRGGGTLRVDKSGTRYVEPGEFDPFVGVATPQDTTGAYTMKQVVFTQSAFGDSVHRTIALAAGVYTDFTFPKTYALTGPDAPRLINEAGVSWLAKSPDPRIGQFEIGIPPFQRRTDSGLAYKRSFVQNGQTQVETGTIMLPPLPVFQEIGNMETLGRFHITGDGLLYTTGFIGFDAPRGSTAPLVTGVQLDYRFVLATTPTAELLTSGSEVYGEFSTTSNSVNEVIGVFSVTAGGRCPELPEPQTFLVDNKHTLSERTSRSSSRAKHIIGYQNGVLQIAVTKSLGVGFDRDESFGGSTTIGDCPKDPWVFSDSHTTQTHTATTDTEAVLPRGGTITSHWVRAVPFGTFGVRTIDFVYEGPLSGSPGTTIQIFDPSARTGQFFVRAFGPRPEDAFVSPNDGAIASKIMFRGVDITNRHFAHDSSPLGEIFFATEDKSVVIHEPKAGGMPQIQVPPDVIRIISAIWL